MTAQDIYEEQFKEKSTFDLFKLYLDEHRIGEEIGLYGMILEDVLKARFSLVDALIAS